MIYPITKLESVLSSQGLHASDILVEMGTIAYATGTCEVPTKATNGNVIGIYCMRCETAHIHDDGSGAVPFTSDLVVSANGITVVTTGSYSGTLFYIIFSRQAQF